jgi:hypothetical protein
VFGKTAPKNHRSNRNPAKGRGCETERKEAQTEKSDQVSISPISPVLVEKMA